MIDSLRRKHVIKGRGAVNTKKVFPRSKIYNVLNESVLYTKAIRDGVKPLANNICLAYGRDDFGGDISFVVRLASRHSFGVQS